MNNIVRMPRGTAMTPTPSPTGTWFWDGTQWTCDVDCPPVPPFPCPPCPPTNIPPFPCPPPGFPPHGCPPWFSGVNSPPWYPGANAGVSFGVTAPTNPVRGHFWWNGLGLAMFDGAVWVDTVTGVILPSTGSPGHPPTAGTPAGGGVVISPTPPANPVAGMEWWNGSILQLWDGTTWKTIGPGATAGPVPTTTLAFAMTSPGSLTVPANPWAIIPYAATPQVDLQQAWDPATHRFTPKKGGVYLFLIREYSTAPAGGTVGIELIKNDPGTFTGTVVALSGISVVGALGAALTMTGVTMMNGSTDFVRLWGYTPTGTFSGAGSDPVFQGVLLP